MMRFLSLLLLGMCHCVVSGLVAMTVMRVLLFVLHVCMMRKCGNGGVVVSAGHVCGTPGSGIVYSADDVLGMSVVCMMRGLGGVCEMCMLFGSGR